MINGVKVVGGEKCEIRSFNVKIFMFYELIIFYKTICNHDLVKEFDGFRNMN